MGEVDHGRAVAGPVIVVGAGIVGLSTAWFLQERGVSVTVVDRVGAAAGSSWGNAGWISPALTIPLNEPATVGYGLRSLLSRTAPLQVPLAAGPAIWGFLARFAAHSTPAAWRRAVRANRALSDDAFAAYDALVAGGVKAHLTDAPITAIFATAADAQRMLVELRRFTAAGQPVSTTELTGQELRRAVPLASPAVTAAVRINDQRFLDPGHFVGALGEAVAARGTPLHIAEVVDVAPEAGGASVTCADGSVLRGAAVVVATGAWLSRLVRRWVKVPVQAGRGYSFTVPVEQPVTEPIYLPDARVACTPIGDRLRVAGTMEFRAPDDPPIPARAEAIVAATVPLLSGVRWAEHDEPWVGPRPVSPDGYPLIGPVRPGVYVAGGHGMWGMAHGPATGRLLAERIVTGITPPALAAFDPLR